MAEEVEHDQDVQEAIAREERAREEGTPFTDVTDEQADELNEDLDSIMTVDTAFLVFVQEGEAFGISKIGKATILGEDDKEFDVHPLREANVKDMWRACTEIVDDIGVSRMTQSVSAHVMQAFQAQAMQIQQQLQNQAITERVLGGNQGVPRSSGLQVPGSPRRR
jgi:hypothetical protein